VLQDRFRDASDEYPLAVGGAFLAAGLLTGLLLPRTEQEDEWMGEASDELKEQTRRKGEELVEEGKEAAARTADAALDEAEKRGMTPDSLAEKARSVVSEATSTAKKPRVKRRCSVPPQGGGERRAGLAGEVLNRKAKRSPGKAADRR
jgi:hypothetical protein